MTQGQLFAGEALWERSRGDSRKGLGSTPAIRPSIDGRGMRDTSRMAFAEQRETGKLAHTQGRIVAWLQARPGQSFTRAEIARGTGLSVASCCGRVNELLHVKRCLVEEPRRTCTISGKAAHPVRAA